MHPSSEVNDLQLLGMSFRAEIVPRCNQIKHRGSKEGYLLPLLFIFSYLNIENRSNVETVSLLLKI